MTNMFHLLFSASLISFASYRLKISLMGGLTKLQRSKLSLIFLKISFDMFKEYTKMNNFLCQSKVDPWKESDQIWIPRYPVKRNSSEWLIHSVMSYTKSLPHKKLSIQEHCVKSVCIRSYSGPHFLEF